MSNTFAMKAHQTISAGVTDAIDKSCRFDNRSNGDVGLATNGAGVRCGDVGDGVTIGSQMSQRVPAVGKGVLLIRITGHAGRGNAGRY